MIRGNCVNVHRSTAPQHHAHRADRGRVGGTAEAPELKAIAAPTVPAYSLPPSVPEPGSSDGIDSLDGRLTQAVAASDPNAGGEQAVWTQHTIAGGIVFDVDDFQSNQERALLASRAVAPDCRRYLR